MDAKKQQSESDSILDSSIIRVELLERSRVTSQPGQVPEQGADVGSRSNPVDPRHREVLKHRFVEGSR